MAGYGRKIGDAWIGIHARDEGTDRLRAIGEKDAEKYAEAFDKKWDAATKDRWERSRNMLVRSLDEQDLRPLVKKFGSLEEALKRSRNELDWLNRTGQITNENFIRARDILSQSAREFRSNERESRRFANALDGMDERLRSLGETDLAKVLASGEWSKTIKDVDTLDDTTHKYTQTLQRLHTEKRITKREYERYRGVLQDLFGDTMDQIVAEERLAEARERQREVLEAHGRALREADRWERQRAADLEAARKEHERLNIAIEENNEAYDRMRDRDLAAIINDRVDWDKVRRNYGDLNRAYESLNERMQELGENGRISADQIETSTSRIRRAINDVSVDMDKIDNRPPMFRRLADNAVNFDRRFNVVSRNFENNIGRMFGRGSRNNFVNFIGAMTRGFVAIPGTIARFASSTVASIGTVITTFGKLRDEGMAIGPALGKSLIPIFLNIGTALATLVVGAMAVATVLPILVSGLTLLAGSLVAVAGAIVTALMGSIVAALPLLGALGVVAGGIAIAVAAAAENSDEWAKATSGLKDVFGDLKQEAMPMLDELMGMIPEIEGLFRDLGTTGLEAVDGLVDSFGRFIDGLNDPAMDEFYSQWGESIPKIVEELSDAFFDFLTGLIAWLAPVLPYAEKLATNIGNAAENFKDWAMSATGQNDVAEWMKIAWEAAEDLWSTLGNVWDILGSIFTSATEGAGGTFLSWLENVTAEWATFLDSEEGQQAMKDFWEDVESFMRSAKDVIVELVDTWNSLDTEESRENLQTILGVVEDLLGVASDVAVEFGKWQTALSAGFQAGGEKGWFTGLITGASTYLIQLDTIKIKMMELGMIENPLDSFFEEASKSVIDLSNALPKSLPIPEQEYVSQVYDAMQRVGQKSADGFNVGLDLGLGPAAPGVANDPLSKWFRDYISGDDLGVRLQEHYRGQVRQGLTGVEQAGPYADTSIEAIRQRLLEGEEISAQDLADMWQLDAAMQALPEQVAVEDTANQIADFFKETFGAGMGEAAEEGVTNFGNMFTSGMGGFTSTASLEMMAIGLGLSENLSTGITTSMATLPSSISGAFEAAKAAAAEGATQTGMAAGDMSAASGQVNTTMPSMTLALQAQMGAAKIAASLKAMEISLAGGDLSGMAPQANVTLAPFVPVISTVMNAANLAATTGASQVVSSGSNLGAMPGKAQAAIGGLPSSIGSVMSAAVGTAATRAAEIRNAGANIGGMVGGARAAISGLGGAIGGVMSAAYATASYWAGRIAAAFAAARASAAAGVSIGMPRMASGGIVYGAQPAVIGEAGMEAVVPLQRNLATVHPAVRELSAFAQGKFEPGETGPRVVVENGAIRVHTSVQNPDLVAESLLDRIVAESGI